ncbi:hypothetical protein KAH27_09805 [bacterium]|nr:hypothetical protein [bacterium]
MITKTPKIIYFLLFLVLVVAADAWRRTWRENDISVSREISPLRKNIREIKRDMDETKSLWLEQSAAISKLEQQLNEVNRLALKQSEKTLALINQADNKLLDELVNGINVNSEVKEVVELEQNNILEKTEPEIVNIVENEINKEKTDDIVEKSEPAKLTENNEKELTNFPDMSVLTSTEVTEKMAENVKEPNLPGEKPVKKEVKKKRKLSLPKRVTSLPAHSAIPEVSIPDKNPDLTSKTFNERIEKKTDVRTSMSGNMLSGRKSGVRMTMSDILESYDEVNEKYISGD